MWRHVVEYTYHKANKTTIVPIYLLTTEQNNDKITNILMTHNSPRRYVFVRIYNETDTWLVVDPHSEDDTSAIKEWLQGKTKDRTVCTMLAAWTEIYKAKESERYTTGASHQAAIHHHVSQEGNMVTHNITRSARTRQGAVTLLAGSVHILIVTRDMRNFLGEANGTQWISKCADCEGGDDLRNAHGVHHQKAGGVDTQANE